MDVRFLDMLYQEKHEASAKIESLKAINAFQACDKCERSEDYGRHTVALQAAQERWSLATLLIGEHVRTHGKAAP